MQYLARRPAVCHGDDPGDPRYPGWSYLGDRYVCPLADQDRACHRRANLLLARQREAELRAMVDEGHRCAFVRLMELLVSQDRADDLRAMALRGDGRAEITLMEYLYRHQDEARLREAVADLPSANLCLARLLADHERTNEALTVLADLEISTDYALPARRLADQLHGTQRDSPQQS